MKSLRKTTLALAVSTAIATIAASNSALAVSISTNGLGQVGLIPFYNVNSGWNTNISVVNTSSTKVAAFKIRFRDAYESKDMRDFNVFLSPNDVWTATVSKPEGETLAIVKMTDKSCTAPDFSTAKYNYQIKFATPGVAGTPRPSQIGHVEIIEMGVADPKVAINQVAKAAVHVNGVPSSCSTVEQVYSGMVYPAGTYSCSVKYKTLKKSTPLNSNDARSQEFCAPENILKVSANLVSSQGVAVDIPVTMLNDFYTPTNKALDLMDEPSSTAPGLNNISPARADFYTEKYGFIGAEFSGAVNPELASLSALLSATTIHNEYMRGDMLTDWVITFPLKYYYGESVLTQYPVSYNYFDKEENKPGVPVEVIQPSPPEPVPVTVSTLKYETQILEFGNGMILGPNPDDGSINELYNLNSSLEASFVSGLMNISFPKGRVITGGKIDKGTTAQIGKAVTITGEAVVGFAVTQAESGGLTVTSVPHAYKRDVK